MWTFVRLNSIYPYASVAILGQIYLRLMVNNNIRYFPFFTMDLFGLIYSFIYWLVAYQRNSHQLQWFCYVEFVPAIVFDLRRVLPYGRGDDITHLHVLLLLLCNPVVAIHYSSLSTFVYCISILIYLFICYCICLIVLILLFEKNQHLPNTGLHDIAEALDDTVR